MFDWCGHWLLRRIYRTRYRNVSNLPIYPGVSVRFSACVRCGEVSQCKHEPWCNPLIWIYRKHIMARSDPDGDRQRRRRDNRGSIRALERQHLRSTVLCHRSLHSAGENGVGRMERGDENSWPIADDKARRPATLSAGRTDARERIPTVFLERNFAGSGGTPIPGYRW